MLGDIIGMLNNWLYTYILVILLIAAGVYFSIRTRFVQFRLLGESFRVIREKAPDKNAASSFQALMVSTASRVGTGNIAGVSTALCLGGVGAVFWMWVIALLGMMTKCVEVTLGGLGTAAFAQPYTMSTALERTFHIPAWVVTVAAAAICGIVLIGGVKGIGKFCEKITPAMCLIYVVGALGVIIVNIRFVPQAFAAIFKYAFAPMPAIGGLAGSTLALALRQGAARGTFSNEAGCGSSPITHATAITDHPFKEGMYGSFEVFVDTIIVCTMTSLAIMCSGSDIWASGVKAEALTMSAFDAAYGTTIGNLLVTIPLALFAFSTMVGWEINYESAFFYIFPKMETSKIFKVLIRVLWLVPGFIALGNTPDLVWTVVDIASGLWCVPNAIALIALSGVFMKIYHDYNDKYILKTRPISEPLPYIGKD